MTQGKVRRREKTAPVGRNDECPCGSGRKFKRCCHEDAGRAAAAAPVEPPPRPSAATPPGAPPPARPGRSGA
ncbi:MAG: SEC-C metal-binding domain-containing protein, partial [Planctomycetota bacterium JB042]